MDPKNFLKSKTFWANALMAIAVPAAQKYAGVSLDATDVGVILAAVNIVLRFVTKGPVVLN